MVRPVTAKLSKRFYDVLGEDVANELNELNFARFDAKLEQRLVELRAKLHDEIGRLRIDLLRWMFGFWATTMLTLAGLTIALLHR